MFTQLKLGERGLHMWLGSLESAIVKAVWSGATTSRDIADYVNLHYKTKNRRNHAFTTITTVIDRLSSRGILVKTMHKRSYVYTCKYATEQDFILAGMQATLATLMTDPTTLKKALTS